MTDFADFKATIAAWANRQDWSDALLTSFVRDAEMKLNSELRIDRMLAVVVNTVDHACAPLPDDWLESDFMLMQSGLPMGWVPIRYKPRDDFFHRVDTPSTRMYDNTSTYGFYTIQGRTIFFGGPQDKVNGKSFEMHYYQEVPVFSDTVNSWVYTKYPALYRYAALQHSDLYAVGEEDKAANLKALVEDMIQKLNNQHRYAKASGSRLARGHVRSFG